MTDLVQTSTLRVVIDPSGAKSGGAEVENAINRVGEASEKSSSKLDLFLDKISKNSASIQKFLTNTIESFLKFATVTVAAAIYALDKLLDRMIDVNVTYNAFIATMTMVKGSVQSAKDEFKYITDYSNRMGASVEDNAKVYIRLAAALKEVDKSGQSARHVFESVSQAQAVLHLKGYETNGIFLAMEQIISKGKLSLEEIQKQLGNRMPEAMGLAARSMNMTQADFRKAITKGSIEPLEFVLKLANQIKIEYGAAAKDAADMFNGQVMRMKNAIFGLYLSVGQTGAMDGLTKIVQSITNLLNDPDVGKQFGESLNRTFTNIAQWISKITAQDVKDFFDSIAATVDVLTDMVGNLNDAFSTTSSGGGTAMIDFMDNFSGALIIITDMTLTFVAALTSIPTALYSMYKDVEVIAKRFEINKSDNWDNEYKALVQERDNAVKMSEANDAILFMTGDSPTRKAYEAKNAAFEKLRQTRLSNAPTLFDEPVPTSTNFNDSLFMTYKIKSDITNPNLGKDNISQYFNAGPSIGGPLSESKIAELAAGGPRAPGGKEKGQGKDVFNSESTALVKAYSVALLEYNNLMDNQIASENKYLTALNAKISTDKNYKKLTDDQLSQLREKAKLADQAALQLKSAEAFNSTRLEQNKLMYSQEQTLLDIEQQRDSLASKNVNILQEKFKFDSAYINMSDKMKSSLLDQAKANDALAVSIRNANAVEQSRYNTLVNTLEVTRNIENLNKGLGVNKYTQEQKVKDSFLKGGSNQFADMATKSKLLADAVKRDFNAMSEDIAQFTFDQRESIDQWNIEIDTVGLTSNEIRKLTESKKVYDYFRLRGIDLSKDENAGYLRIADTLSNEVTTAIDLVYKKQTDGFTGAKRGFASYIEDSQNMARVMEDIVSKSFKGMEDALTDLIVKGKTSFKELADSIKADLARAFVKSNITGPLAEWMNGSSGGSGALSSIVSLFSNSSGSSDSSNTSTGLIGKGVSMLASYFGSSAGSTTVGMGPTVLGAKTGLGSLASSGGTAAGGSSISSAIPIVGWVLAGMAANNSLYDQGWGGKASNDTKQMGIASGMVGGVLKETIQKWFGLSDKSASMWSGSAVVNRLFGHKLPELQQSELSGSFGENGYTATARDVYKSKGGIFRSDKWSETKTVATNTDEMTKAFEAIKAAAAGYAGQLGFATDSVDKFTKDFKFNLSITGDAAKDAEANKKLISDLLVEVSNDISKFLVPSIAEFSKEGETTSQTLARISSNFVAVNDAFEILNLKLFESSQVGIKAANNFADLIGGVEALNNVSKSYFENFFSSEEKTTYMTKQLSDEFNKLQVGALPKSREAFKSLVEEISKSGTPEQLAGLLKLNSAFAQLVPVTEVVADVLVTQFDAQRKIEVAAVAATQALEAQAKATAEIARAEQQKTYDQTLQSRLRSGKVNDIMADNYALNPIDMLASVSGGQFDAAGFNSKIIRQRAEVAIDLSNKASADAISVEDISSVLSSLFDFTKDREFENELRKSLPANARNQVSETVGYVFSDFVDASIAGIRLNQFTARGPGITSVIAAQEDLQYQTDLQTAYRRSMSSANEMLYQGIITQEQYQAALFDANEILKDNVKSQESLNEALQIAGLNSIAFYFDQIGLAVDNLNEVAKETAEPLGQVSSAIGRFKSIDYVFSTSANAAGGDSNAELVAKMAKEAADVLTTQDAMNAAKSLSSKESFAGVTGSDLRDISLLLDGIRQFDAISFENAFLRITNALNKGVITQSQYTDLFNQGMMSFKGLAQESEMVKNSFADLQKSMRNYADQLLIDRSKTTLSPKATQEELIRQYEVARVEAATGTSDSVSKFLSLANQMTDISRFGSREEYNVAFGKVYGDVRNIERLAEIKSADDRAVVVAELKNIQTMITQEVLLVLSQIAKNTKDTSNKMDV